MPCPLMTGRARQDGRIDPLPWFLAKKSGSRLYIVRANPGVKVAWREDGPARGWSDAKRRAITPISLSRGAAREPLMDALADIGRRPQQFGGRARNPAPDDAGQLVVATPEALRLALGNCNRVAAVASYEEQRRLPDLALVRHHHDLINPGRAVQFHRVDRPG